MYENTEPWEKSVPADLIPAIKYLRKSFDDAHWKCGRITEIFCFSLLHRGIADEEVQDHLKPLMQLKGMVGAAAAQRFHDLIGKSTPPAIFKGFYDLYLDGLSIQTIDSFKELIEIGRANEKRLNTPYLEWAEAQTKHLIRSHTHSIKIWVKNVCDKQVYDPTEDEEEQIFWRKWQAPMLLVMKPSLYQPYEAAREWERRDAVSSAKLLEHFAQHYVLHLEVQLSKAVGKATLELAKHPKPMQASTADNNLQHEELPRAMAEIPTTQSTARRDARKLDTQAKYKSWQKAYREVKKEHPNMSDTWYSQRIAKMDLAKGQSADTIRKHMKK